jgi:4-hydroxythreonine-4-phosphate dehydrogenase
MTMGEPAGIGGEIALKAWLETRGEAPDAASPFFLLDDPARLSALAADLGLDTPIEEIHEPGGAAAVFAKALPVLPVPLPSPVRPGHADPANAEAVLESIRRAVTYCREGAAAAVVTNPIRKQTLYDAGFTHPGHTEYLAELCGPAYTPVMMLACPGLRVVPATVHCSLKDAVERLTSELIVEQGVIVHDALVRDFGIAAPRIAVAGLNPHAGEGGALGEEEREIIEPAIEALRAKGMDVQGPAPADSLFHPAARAKYDACICMYHDQALIPIKTIDFDHGVNITLGLPIVRTSPDHGTALDIAGTGSANPASLIAALQSATEIARNRAAHG